MRRELAPVVTTLGVACALLATAAPARAQDPESLLISRVRLTTDAAVTAHCTRLGRVRDDSVKDLRRKILRLGGNTGLLSFPLDELSKMDADVFRCAGASSTTAPPPPPPGVPPPPAGTPPPPPPGPAR